MSSLQGPSGLRRVALRDQVAHVGGGAAAAVAGIAMLLPAVMVVAQSFSNDSFFSFPPRSWGLRQYRTMFQDPVWSRALGASLRLGAAVAGLSAAVVVPAVFALHRSRLPGRWMVLAGGVSGLVIPVSAFAVALYGVFVQLRLLGTWLGVALAHATVAAPVMLLVVTSAMTRLPVELELAAMVAGASRRRAWLGITARILLPAMLAGALLSFVASFDEAVLVVFLGGQAVETLPRAILNSVRIGIDPVVTAIATLLIVGTSAATIAAFTLTSGRRAGR